VEKTVIDFVDYIVKAVCAALGSTMAVVFRVSKDQRKNLRSRFFVGAVGGYFMPPLLGIYRPELADLMGLGEQALFFFAGGSFYLLVELVSMRQKQTLAELEEAKNGDS
jgi:hypothetical protein